MLKDKMKTYNFWISLVSAVLLVARLIAGKFNVEIDSSLVMDVTTGLCGIFVVLGIISAPQKTVTKFIDRPLDGIIAQPVTDNGETKSDNNAPTTTIGHCEERSDVAIPSLGEEATVNSEPAIGENDRVVTDGVISPSIITPLIDAFVTNVAPQVSATVTPLVGEEVTVNSEATAPLGEDGRVATEGVISSLFTAPRIDEAETEVAAQSEKDAAGVTQSEEDCGVVIESEGNANDGANQMPNPNGGVNQITNINDGVNQMPNLAEFSKEQLIEIICANPQFLNAGKNGN